MTERQDHTREDRGEIRSELLPELYTMIRSVLELPEHFALESGMKIVDVPGWDSLGWVSVITAVEEKYQREVDIEGIQRMETISDLERFIRSPDLHKG